MSINLLKEVMPPLLHGAVTTVTITLASMAFALVLGLLLALARLSVFFPLRWLSYAYIEVFRGTPILVQLFLIYFGLPEYGILLSPYTAGVLGLGLNYSAYLAEVYRAGILSINIGQREAGASLGLSRTHIMRHIILPQAFRTIVPPAGNYFISLIKDTALVSTISVYEMMEAAQVEVSATFQSLPIYLIVAGMYFLMSFPLARLLYRLEAVMAPKG